MHYVVSGTTPRMIFVVFERDDLLLEGLTDVVRKEGLHTAAITSGVGSLQTLNVHTFARFGFPPEAKPLTFKGAIEIGALQGTVASGEVHAHITFYHWDTQATWVGHLDAGSAVAYVAEVSLLEIPNVRAERYQDAAGDYHVRLAGV